MSWRYYVANGSQPDCSDNMMFCPPRAPGRQDARAIWNPLPRFDDVQQDHQIGNIQPLGDFYQRRAQGHAAAVSWIVPEPGR